MIKQRWNMKVFRNDIDVWAIQYGPYSMGKSIWFEKNA